MTVNLITLGKLKEDYLRKACAEYEKRLSAFVKISIIELEPVKLPDDPNQAQIDAALETESARIFAKIPQGSFTAAMCIEGGRMTSERLAEKLSAVSVSGKSTVNFVIGSSYGLSDKVKKAADLRLSMSEMTFPHQLARVMLLEQIYRAYTIINNRKYHK